MNLQFLREKMLVMKDIGYIQNLADFERHYEVFQFG